MTRGGQKAVFFCLAQVMSAFAILPNKEQQYLLLVFEACPYALFVGPSSKSATSSSLSLSMPVFPFLNRNEKRGRTGVSAKIEGFPFIRRCCPFLLFQLRHNCPSSVFSSVERSCTALSLFISHPLFCHPAVLEGSTKLSVKSRTWDLFLTKSCTRSLVYKGWLIRDED